MISTRMRADAQRDGRPAEYRWRRLRKFRNSTPCTTPQTLTDVRARVPCSNAANIGERKTCRYVPYLRRYSPTKLCDGAQTATFGVISASCIFPVLSASIVQHISDMHSKFALRRHHVRKYMVDIHISDR